MTRVAIVTGGGTGIGKVAALALLRGGYSVVLAGRRQAPLEQVIVDAGTHGPRALAVPTDVSDPVSVKHLFDVTRARDLDASTCSSTMPGWPPPPSH